MSSAGITEEEIKAFFAAFCSDFAQFNGEILSARYTAPYLALAGDGSLECFATKAEIALHFQTHLDRYRESGCTECAFEHVEIFLLGKGGAIVSLNWRLTSNGGNLVGNWRESYNMVRTRTGLKIYASTDHVVS